MGYSDAEISDKAEGGKVEEILFVEEHAGLLVRVEEAFPDEVATVEILDKLALAQIFDIFVEKHAVELGLESEAVESLNLHLGSNMNYSCIYSHDVIIASSTLSVGLFI